MSQVKSPAAAGLFLLSLVFCAGAALAQGDAKRGLYLSKAGGCVGCHTQVTKDPKDAVPYAGGRALKTPFGTFYGPNITPHPTAGIGKWSEADFIRAMREGKRVDGSNYFPAFPYASFTGMTDADLRDLWAYLRTLPPSGRASQEHELGFLYRWRIGVSFWKWLYFEPGPLNVDQKTPVGRGAYVANALGHCGECHTPRTSLGGMKRDRWLGGSSEGPEGKGVPNITRGRLKWSESEIRDYLQTGMTSDGDVANETMGEVITNTTSQLTPQDLAALVAYLRSIPPVESEKKN
ncbi:MAG TPA: cytochrome c [Burkholderiales bacterium]